MNYLVHFITKNNQKPDIKNITVGIPKAMMFYEHGALWEDFFRRLGCRVITSGSTNKRIMNQGVACCSNENCLPVKVLTGHVLDLIDKCDFIFIPRYKSTDKMEFTCPKFCGLPDMMRMNLKGRAEVKELDIDLNKGESPSFGSIKTLSDALSLDYEKVKNTFFNMIKDRLRPEMETSLLEPDEVKNLKTPLRSDQPAIGVLGHPYVIHDSFISMNLFEKLRNMNYRVLTPAHLERTLKRQNAYPNQDFFYGVGYDILGSAFTLSKDPSVKGLIYLSTFSCGVDSILTEYIDRHLKQTTPIPYMKITIDEHTGEAGFDTRLEAFLDMIGGKIISNQSAI